MLTACLWCDNRAMLHSEMLKPRPQGSGLGLDLGLECLTSASRFWPRSWPRPQRSGLGLDLGLECLTSASTFWPRSWPRPQRSGLGLDLGLNVLASVLTSASSVWPQPQGSGLGLDLSLACLTSASRFWPRSWPQPRVFDHRVEWVVIFVKARRLVLCPSTQSHYCNRCKVHSKCISHHIAV